MLLLGQSRETERIRVGVDFVVRESRVVGGPGESFSRGGGGATLHREDLRGLDLKAVGG